MLSFRTERGKGFHSLLDELGELRIQVFRQWPYLYEGDLDYERKYLSTYAQSATSFGFFVYDENQKKLVGATTAIELSHESSEFQEPFLKEGIDTAKVVYFGESILLPEYRGQKIGQRFMEERLHFARSFPQKDLATFCAVIRPENHPARPENYRSLETFWKNNGFFPKSGMLTEYGWKDVGDTVETKKQMQFWIRSLKE